MKVYQAICRVQSALAAIGIGKDRRNEQQGYKFRGIDDICNASARLLAAESLCILPRCTERTAVERTNAKGTSLFYVTVRVEFDFVSAEDGSTHTVVTYGEAMDSGDKATNKAMSAAYKYALLQTFAIPTEGDNDADATTHKVSPVAKMAASGGARREADDIFAALPPEAQAATREVAMEVTFHVDAGHMDEAARVIGDFCADADDKLALWSQLPAPVRSKIKAYKK